MVDRPEPPRRLWPWLPGGMGRISRKLVALLTSTGCFDSVIFGDPTGASGVGADSHPVAIIVPKGWEEADETDPTLLGPPGLVHDPDRGPG